ncbi:MAG: biotin/lipoyl-containing protein, partial [Chloroflexota bacterium]|nr:biotin/lipoyl-containing protein [Chloroflexota bacterium]
MAVTVVMPQMGYDMREGKVVKWLKREGETVRRGEPLAEIETDKAVVEMPASGEGVVRKILVAEGTTVPVGKAIAIIGTADEPLPEMAEVVAPTPTPAPTPPTPTPPPTPAPAGEVRASPLARRLAEELGVDLRTVTGTGPGGRITEADVRRAAERAKAPPPAPP